MAMSSMDQLQWRRAAGVSSAALSLIAACIVCAVALFYWKQALEQKTVAVEARFARMDEQSRITPRAATPVAVLTPAAVRQLREQASLLNRDWVGLSNMLVPGGSDVRLLGMDVNPATGAVRITALAGTRLVANSYAESLAGRSDELQQVKLLGLEQRSDGIRFEVSAQWSR